MYKVIERVYECGALVGYRVKDDTGTVSLMHSLKFKKAVESGEVYNCVVEEGRVIGANGFQLTSLPKRALDS